jgi:diguanylate cyclase (GGDEF)-like protein
LIGGLKKSLEKEKALARTDYLTDLANRRNFFEAADAEINRSSRNKLPFTMAYIDSDNFKSINDNFGHATGDRVLKIIAMGIKKNIRKMDTAARIGGDEFAVLLPETNSEAAKHAMDKIYMLLSEAMKGLAFPITFSVGVVTFMNPPKDADEMIKITDELMYSVKAMGKNNIKYEIN